MEQLPRMPPDPITGQRAREGKTMRYIKATVNVTKVTCLVRRFNMGKPAVENEEFYLDGRCTDLTRALRTLRKIHNTDTVQILAADKYEVQTRRFTMPINQFIKLAKQCD